MSFRVGLSLEIVFAGSLSKNCIKEMKGLRILDVQSVSSGFLSGFAKAELSENLEDFEQDMLPITHLTVRPSHTFTKEDAAQIQGLLKVVNRLQIFALRSEYKPETLERPMQILSTIPYTVEDLDLSGMYSMDDEELYDLRRLSRLCRLCIGVVSGNELTYSRFGWVENLTALTYLRLITPGVSDVSFSRLRSLKLLLVVWVTTKHLTPAAFAQLSWVKSLKTLIIHGVKIDASGEDRIAHNRLIANGVNVRCRFRP